MAHDRMLATAGSYSWIHKYIFPGSIIASLQAIDEVNAGHTSLRVIESRRLGLSYARTLDRWRHSFAERTDEVLGLGFDETFMRMWDFYLGYCQAGFATHIWTSGSWGSVGNESDWTAARVRGACCWLQLGRRLGGCPRGELSG